MSNSNTDAELEDELAKERQRLIDKLSSIFNPEIANDYVCPKTNETRQQLTLEELRLLNFNDQDEYLQRLRSLVHYKTTTQSLSRADLEASYQSFVRDQVAQHPARYELEQYVRNTSDIDAAKRFIDMGNDALTNPQQSLLLFRSSKLNEQKAHLLKSSGYSNSLQQLNDDPSIQKYFPETLTDTRRDSPSDEEEYFNSKENLSRCRSMHLQHNNRKYHIRFLKDYDAHNAIYRSRDDQHFLLTDRLPRNHVESLLSAETSTSKGHITETHTSSIHRETFPPLSLSALKEYRPTMTPQPTPSRSRSSSKISIGQRRKPLTKSDFIWNRSVVSPTKNQ